MKDHDHNCPEFSDSPAFINWKYDRADMLQWMDPSNYSVLIEEDEVEIKKCYANKNAFFFRTHQLPTLVFSNDWAYLDRLGLILMNLKKGITNQNVAEIEIFSTFRSIQDDTPTEVRNFPLEVCAGSIVTCEQIPELQILGDTPMFAVKYIDPIYQTIVIGNPYEKI